MITRLVILLMSKYWFWIIISQYHKIILFLDKKINKGSLLSSRIISNTWILIHFGWIGIKNLFKVILSLMILVYIENNFTSQVKILSLPDVKEINFYIDQLRLYAQILTAIFSIYFATVGIILSSGYTNLRQDIIQLLTSEQVGSVYSQIIVLTTIFCLVSTSLPAFDYNPGILIYFTGTILTLLSILTLFPLGQRLFRFFDLKQLVQSEISPSIRKNIASAIKFKKSATLSRYYSEQVYKSINQLSYIDKHIRSNTSELENSLPSLAHIYSILLLNYLKSKNGIDKNSFWFPRKIKYKQWFLAGDSITSQALKMSDQNSLREANPDNLWFENEIIGRLIKHIETAFEAGNTKLALKLINLSHYRIEQYADQFQFDIAVQEAQKIRLLIDKYISLSISNEDSSDKIVRIRMADTWTALVSNLCLLILRRIITFDKAINDIFKSDIWSDKTLNKLPHFLNYRTSMIISHIRYEYKIEGRRLSKPKYIQQLIMKDLLTQYSIILNKIVGLYQETIPQFAEKLIESQLPEAATQVTLASLHTHWKLPRIFEDITDILNKYKRYEHYIEDSLKLPPVEVRPLIEKLSTAREKAITSLSNRNMIKHVFEPTIDDEQPDHFGQIYFELAESCIEALRNNDEDKLSRTFPTFMLLAIQAADFKFTDPSLDIDNIFRIHLVSSVINDLASVLGFSILYSEFYKNDNLSNITISEFI